MGSYQQKMNPIVWVLQLNSLKILRNRIFCREAPYPEVASSMAQEASASPAPFDLQPTLEGNLIKLRPLEVDDFEDLYSVASDPLIWELHPEKYRYKREVFEKFFGAALESRGALVGIDRLTNKIVGSSRYTGFDPIGNIEVGYTFLSRSYWGRGFNEEMKRLMLNYAFHFVDGVLFYIGEDNLRSRKAIEKIGATLIDKIERQTSQGDRYSAVVYKIEKRDWGVKCGTFIFK